MKTISLRGQKREQIGKSATRQLRTAGYVPCELYGKSGNIHFSAFVSDFTSIVYTPETYKVILDLDGQKVEAVIKEIQFHPLNDEILHVDFFEIDEDKRIKLELPIHFLGTAAGAREGGKLVRKLRTLKVKGLPQDMPAAIELDITTLGLGKSLKVRDINAGNLEILNSPSNPVITVEVPRGMRGKQAEEAAPTGKKK